MTDYTIIKREDVDDVLGDYPGEMRMLTGALGAEQVALTWRRMPQHTGGKGGYGHRHKSQEELYFVLARGLRSSERKMRTSTTVAPSCSRRARLKRQAPVAARNSSSPKGSHHSSRRLASSCSPERRHHSRHSARSI